MTFVDTSALYAVFDRSDAQHGAAARYWRELIEGDEVLLVSNYILIETAALVQHRLGVEALRVLNDDVVPVLTIDWISEVEHMRAMHAVLAANRRQLSVVDCSSFQVMRQRRCHKAFTFDPHFAEQGFDIVPSTGRGR